MQTNKADKKELLVNLVEQLPFFTPLGWIVWSLCAVFWIMFIMAFLWVS